MTAPTPSEDVAITQAICDGTIADYIAARVAEAVRVALVDALDGFGGCEGEDEWYVCINEGGDVREYETAKEAVRGVFDYGSELARRDQTEADAKIASDLCGRCIKDLCSCCRIADAIRARGKRLGRDMTDSTDWNVE